MQAAALHSLRKEFIIRNKEYIAIQTINTTPIIIRMIAGIALKGYMITIPVDIIMFRHTTPVYTRLLFIKTVIIEEIMTGETMTEEKDGIEKIM